MKSYALIVNPSSGRGRALRKAEALRRRLGDATIVQVLQSQYRGAAMDLALEAARRVDRVIAIGGDGTLHEVLNGLMRSGLEPPELPELGFLPAGTANVAARAFDLDSDPDAVAIKLVDATTTPVDVGIVEYEGGRRAFLLWCGAGWDAVVISALNDTRTGLMGVSGVVGRIPRVLRAIARYHQPPITSAVDGSAFGAYSSVIVANVGLVAFGGVVTHAADPTDGLFNVVGVPRTSLRRLIALGVRMWTTSLTRSSVVRHRPGRHIALLSDGEVPFQLDGEPVGILPATVTLMRGAVRLLKS